MNARRNDRPLLAAVFGMHRSGTSALARALQVFDISPGERLQPSASDNEKGFWEDIDVVALSERALATVDRRWNSVAPLTAEDMARIESAGLVDEAAALLTTRLQTHPRFGFKDPRAAKLGAMWRAAIARTGAEAVVVIAVRHPLSVARSLAARDALGTERSLLLWLDHVMASLRHSAGLPRAVVDFDRLLAEPAAQLRRIGAAIGQPPQRVEADLFAREFLDARLRHSSFRPEDLRLDPAAHATVADLYEIVRACAEDSASLDGPQVQSALDRLQVRLDEMLPLLRAADQADGAQERLQRLTSERLRAVEAEAISAQAALESVQALALDRGRECDRLQSALTDTQALALARAEGLDAAESALRQTQALAHQRAEQIDTLQATLDQVQGLALARSASLDAAESALQQAQALAHQRAEQIDTLQTTLDQVQALAVARTASLDAAESALQQTQALALQRAKQIDTLQAALDEAQTLAVARAERLDATDAALRQTQALVQQQAERLTALEQTLTTTENERARYRDAYATVVASRSWRMTAMLRRAWARLSGRPLPELPEP